MVDKLHIIPRSEHSISRKQLDSNALRVLYRLRDNGFTAYLVGGCVRDLLLGREPKDFDLATDATPPQLKRLFRNCRLVGRRFRLAHLHFADEVLEVATFRANEQALPEADLLPDQAERAPRHLKSEAGMVLRDNVFGTPEEDALRRDFTVNALFYNIVDFSVIDYTGGMDDLKSGIIRTIGDPGVRITEDPVRMLRAIRFAALLGFTIDEPTWKAILEQAPAITMATPPRLYEELLKLFLLGEGEKSYQLLKKAGILAALFPRFSHWLDQETDGFPHTTVGAALDWIDSQVQRGGKVSPALFLALMFGQYLDEKRLRFVGGGAAHQHAVELAVAELMQELVVTIHIPGRVAATVRHILVYQQRFGKTPGKHVASFVKRPGFEEALEYLCATGELSGTGTDLGKWWRKLVEETKGDSAAPGSAKAGIADGEKRKRRRRRKKKPAVQT